MDKDITAANVYIADFGIKVFFLNESYGNPKKPGIPNHLYYEAVLLRNFSKLITEIILHGESSNLQLLDEVPLLDPELKCILWECYRAVDRIHMSEEENYLTPKMIKDFVLKKKRLEY